MKKEHYGDTKISCTKKRQKMLLHTIQLLHLLILLLPEHLQLLVLYMRFHLPKSTHKHKAKQ